MNEQRFRIANRDELRSTSATVPVAYHLSRVLSGSKVVHEVAEKSFEEAPETGWIIFQGIDGCGFGVQHGELMKGSSTIQRTLEYVRGAEAVVKSFGGIGAFSLELSLEGSPPSDWRFQRIDALVGELWLATSTQPPPLKVSVEAREMNPSVRCKVECYIPDVAELVVEQVVRCERMRVSVPEVGVSGRLLSSKGGEMSIEVESHGEVYEQHIPGVRIDLGEIEVRLSDLVSLRPGVVVNLGEVTLERCYLRLGATMLAEGRFSSKGGDLLLTIDSVL